MTQSVRYTAFSHSLAAYWPSFVDCPKRLITEAPLLDRITWDATGEPILDACAGIGCESIYLRKRGLEVTSNEIDPELRAVASTIAGSQGVHLQFTGADWRSIGEAFPPISFQTILLMGNSLGLLNDLKEILESLRQLYALLRPGGKLVLDQRNYDYILNRRESILRGDFRYSRRYVYCGESITGRPLKIS
jgi:SAM-dependent methyltransferase